MRVFSMSVVFMFLSAQVSAASIEVLSMLHPTATPKVLLTKELFSTKFDLDIPMSAYLLGSSSDAAIKIAGSEPKVASIVGTRFGESKDSWQLTNVGKFAIGIFSGGKLLKNLEPKKTIDIKLGYLYKIGPSTFFRLR